MSDHRILPVLLAGGTGTRLWPVSRDAMPKQFLPLIGDQSTFQQALRRVAEPDLFAPPLVLTSENFRFFARRQADETGLESTTVLEPMRRDSGPAIAAAAIIAQRRGPETIMLVLAADHVILDPDRFRTACLTGREAAMAGHIVTFGVRPTAAKTGYGYIRLGPSLAPDGVYAVAAFVEKPDSPTAARYVTDGYLWNSGNFMFRADVLIDEFTRHEPAIVTAAAEAVAKATSDLGFVRLDPAAFSRAPQKSIDYAVMEKTSRAAVVEARFRWSDIGSWESVFEVGSRDGNNNAVSGPVVSVDSENCLVHAQERFTAVLGIKDLIVVTTPDAVLVLPRDRAEDVKQLVIEIKKNDHREATDHRRVFRPWGHYQSVDVGDRFQVKRIVVTPAGRLSLQKHMHRAEHWVVVRGTAEVTIGDKTSIVHENESIYVPLGAVHRLANPGKIPLELIEVQTGSYLGEDDIVRLEDIYQRT